MSLLVIRFRFALRKLMCRELTLWVAGVYFIILIYDTNNQRFDLSTVITGV